MSVLSLIWAPSLCLQWERQDQGSSGRLWSRPGQGLHPQVHPLPAGRRPAFLSGHRGQESHTAQVHARTHAYLCTPTCTRLLNKWDCELWSVENLTTWKGETTLSSIKMYAWATNIILLAGFIKGAFLFLPLGPWCTREISSLRREQRRLRWKVEFTACTGTHMHTHTVTQYGVSCTQINGNTMATLLFSDSSVWLVYTLTKFCFKWFSASSFFSTPCLPSQEVSTYTLALNQSFMVKHFFAGLSQLREAAVLRSHSAHWIRIFFPTCFANRRLSDMKTHN